MLDPQTTRLTDAELKAFLDRMFPQGITGADVLAELAPEGWERSPLLACFLSGSLWTRAQRLAAGVISASGIAQRY